MFNNYFPVLFLWLAGVGPLWSQNAPKHLMENANLGKLEKWEAGFFDIHHINTGSGNSCFMIFPDGTTLVFDAGSLDKIAFEESRAPLKATSPMPSDSLSTAGWIANYITNVHPEGKNAKIDYALVSHFHGDHYGSLVALGNLLPIKKVIDRDYPNYDFPLDLRKQLAGNRTFQDYLKFLDDPKVKASSLKVGESDQIVLLKNPAEYNSFTIRNVKANAQIWTGKSEDKFHYFSKEQMIGFYKGSYNENPLSLALKISYGAFDYFTGGDNTGLQGYGMPQWFDVETPIAQAVGKVEALTLNHHGNRDATNMNFVETLNPKVVVQQLWCSDHPGQEVYQRLIYDGEGLEKRDIFSTNMHPETLVTYGPWFKDNYKSTGGHVLIRVGSGGKSFSVFILDEATLKVKQKHGPYTSQW